jgi:ribosomal protein S26
MGVTYKPEDARRRRTKDKALKDLDPSLREPTKKIIENTAEDLPISKQIKGQIREEVGKLTDNKTEQLKGKIEQVQGKVQEGIGNENLIKCLKCGYEIPEDSNYCKFCGIRQGSYIIEEFKVAAIEVLKRVEVLLHEGDITRIVVKDESGKQLSRSLRRWASWVLFASLGWLRLGLSLLSRRIVLLSLRKEHRS